MEGLRGDERIVIAGMSGPRWMSVAQGGVGLAISDPGRLAGPAGISLCLTLVLVLAVAAIWRSRVHARTDLDPTVLRQMREFVALSGSGATSTKEISARTFGDGLSIAVSPWAHDPTVRHVSFSMPAGRRDLAQLARIIVTTIPDAVPAPGGVSDRGAVHVLSSRPDQPDRVVTSPPDDVSRLYGSILRDLQLTPPVADEGPTPTSTVSPVRSSYFEAPMEVRSSSNGARPGGRVRLTPSSDG